MAEEKSADGWWSKSFLVLLGAICGVLPVLVSQYLQAGAQREQQLLDRRISLFRDYGSACRRVVTALDTMATLMAIIDANSSHVIEFKEVQKLLQDFQSATRDLFVEGSIAKTLLGIDLKVTLPSSARQFVEGVQAAQGVKAGDQSAIALVQKVKDMLPQVIEQQALECEEQLEAIAERVTSFAKHSLFHK